jgi:hypothetical protein
MTNDEREANDELQMTNAQGAGWDFGFRHSFEIRHSSFVIPLQCE